MWERGESARIEIEHGYPHLYAQALLSVNSAFDAMVEDLVTTWRGFAVKPLVDQMQERAAREVPEAAARIDPEAMQALTEIMSAEVAKRALGKVRRLAGSGVERYESVLQQIGLGAPDDRPIPDDMAEALTELGAIRDVLVHRAGRVDVRALKQAPTLHSRYALGQLVRITRDNYRRYSAAIRCYAEEIWFRAIRNWPEVSDADGPDLSQWSDYHLVGV